MRRTRRASAARRAELIRFADEFEAAVGAIVSNVSASAGAARAAAAGTLTRTAETTQSLSSQVAGASEEASSNIQSVATATEELSASVDEIGRQVRESNRIAEAAVAQAEADRRAHRQIVARGAADRRRRQADHGDRRADQSAGAQRHHRGGPRRRCRPRLCRGRLRGQIAGEPDREGDRRDLRPHLRHAGARPRNWSPRSRRSAAPSARSRTSPSSIASAVEQQGSATQEIARSVQNVAQGTREAAANIMQVNRGATETGSASEEVLNSAQHAVERKHPPARRTRPLHGEYPRGVTPDSRRHSGAQRNERTRNDEPCVDTVHSLPN